MVISCALNVTIISKLYYNFIKVSIGFMMKTFVIFDTIALVWSFVIFQYLPSIGLDPSIMSSFTCHTFFYISRIIQEIPLFIQAFISFINYLGVCYQSKFLYLKKKFNLYISFMVIILFISFVNIPNMFPFSGRLPLPGLMYPVSHILPDFYPSNLQ